MVLFKKRVVKSKGVDNSRRKRLIEEQHDSSSDSDTVEDGVKSVTVKNKRIKQGSTVENSDSRSKDLGLVSYSANSNGASNEGDATRENTFYKIEREEEEKRARDRERVIEEAERANDDNFRGSSGYKKLLGSNTAKPKFGPLKAATNVRSTTIIDYQPDVCKDYKLTGYCGYGDNCKFLHSREDYKAGWALDKEWESKTKEGEPEEKIPADEPEEIPFKCVICKKDYRSPVVTPCGHYFCETCFLGEYRKKPNCFICGKATGGIIQPAKNLTELLAKRGHKV